MKLSKVYFRIYLDNFILAKFENPQQSESLIKIQTCESWM